MCIFVSTILYLHKKMTPSFKLCPSPYYYSTSPCTAQHLDMLLFLHQHTHLFNYLLGCFPDNQWKLAVATSINIHILSPRDHPLQRKLVLLKYDKLGTTRIGWNYNKTSAELKSGLKKKIQTITKNKQTEQQYHLIQSHCNS